MAGGLEVAPQADVCWLAEGYASQRDMALAIKAAYPDILLLVSHRDDRQEILGCGDIALREPRDEEERAAFIEEVIRRHAVTLLHAGRRGRWFESRRARLESLGVRLSTGACREADFVLADNKLQFSTLMREAGLPVVPALPIERAEDLREALRTSPFGAVRLCVKPVQGVYGQGFRILDDSVSLRDVLADTAGRRVPSAWYLRLLEETPEPLLLMPYCGGDEYSVDMLVRQGRALCSVQRRKHGLLQDLEAPSEATEIAYECARLLGCDGLVNIQLIEAEKGHPLLLEANLRPSGGIGYGLAAGCNLPALWAGLMLGRLGPEEVARQAAQALRPVTIRPLTVAVPLPPAGGERWGAPDASVSGRGNGVCRPTTGAQTCLVES